MSVILIAACLYCSVMSTTAREATVGQRVILPCHVDDHSLSDVKVQWLDPSDSPITFGTDVTNGQTDRYFVDHPYPYDWNLGLTSVRTEDAGTYTCRIGTRPVTSKSVELKVNVPPSMVNSTRDVTIAAGSDLTLECFATGTPEPQINWFKKLYNRQLTDLGVSGNWLVLKNVTRQDAGAYECHVDNGVKPPTLGKMRVDVLFAPEVNVPYREISQQETATVIMSCVITANPRGEFYWVKDDERVVNSSKHQILDHVFGEYQYMLTATITDLAKTDFGDYQCVAENVNGRVDDKMAKVTIYEFQTGRIHVISTPKDTIVKVGSETTLDCSVNSLDAGDSLLWYRKEGDIYRRLFLSHGVESGSVSLSDENKYEIRGQYNLVIKSTAFDDAGVYICEITGYRNYTAELSVLGPLSCESTNMSVDDGAIAETACSVLYSGPRDSSWRIDWIRADTEERMPSIANDGTESAQRTLLLKASYPQSDADYICTVTSRRPVYVDNCTTHLNVRSNRAGNTSSSCQEHVGCVNGSHSSQTILILSLIIVALIIAHVVTIACCVTQWRHQEVALARERSIEMKPLKNNGVNV